MKKLTLVALMLTAGWLGMLPAQAQEAAKPLTIEQQLFNDFASRMQTHLHKTASLLDKIRQSSDAKERQKLMQEYHQANQTTMKINHAMHMLAGGKGSMMAGKKMGSKGEGMGCMMMKKKSAGAAEAGGDTAAAEEADATETSATAQQPQDSSEHEGHH
jgi:hypothetical protein